ncbi:protein of unknown function [Magnetospirillum gryphiswaldense MSR-1 v2]|jgi:hypothetical protein|uniref:Secreted protein n=1 Tax=Magnetospirillum gryphiswaldense (strain DSM 6361 / JCM 21280 / NBRC 15271 / MSR-1) TaxID=431944 RepID=V6EXJ3_MAGGM|nr:hypothetical protein [Magnetospirillum gryphiswaldense]CDK97919.1 protein of unknown function [Magnetospirillum gryphiswaldense MSR-1 v2]CDL01247.1 protein of unknown function [Magnetospirillum gryphiswaldense MSR-1 v2]
MRKLPLALVILTLLSPLNAISADKPEANPDAVYASNRAVDLEVMRLRLGTNPSPGATATLIEAEDLLRRFKQAPAKDKPALRSQIDAAVARMEMDAATMKQRDGKLPGD